MYYKEDLIEEIRHQSDIVEIIGQYVHLEKKGGSFFGLCPFHNEKTPSFSVSADKQMYYCFGCGNGGNVFTFLMEYENWNFQEAIAYLADRAHIALPEAVLSEEEQKKNQYRKRLYEVNYMAAKFFYYRLQQENTGRIAKEYLKKRKISEEIAKKFGLGYATVYRDDLFQFLSSKGFSPKEMLDAGLIMVDKNQKDSYYDRFFNRLMFPIWDSRNRIIAFGGRVFGEATPKYLNSPETEIFEKSKNLYGLHLAKSSRKSYFLLVEGYMDVISLQEAGFDSAVASLGTAFNKNHAHAIKRYMDKVYLAFDGDLAGIQAALRAIPVLKSEGMEVRVISLGDCKDPDELIQKKGKEAFEKAIEEAVPAFMFEIAQLSKNYQLKDPSDQIAFSEEVVKRLLTLDSKLEIHNYRDAVIREYHLDAEGVNDFLRKKGKEKGIAKFNTNEVLKKDITRAMGSAEEELICVMVSHQQVYDSIKKHIQASHFQDSFYRKMFELIVDIYAKGDFPNPVLLMHHFPEAEEQKKIAKIFNRKMEPESQFQLAQMVEESIRAIRQADLRNRQKNTTDSKELMNIIEEKKKLLELQIQFQPSSGVGNRD